MPSINRAQLATMIGRITNTISDSDKNYQAFTREMLVTFATVVKSDIDPALLPAIFWCACACLSTTIEAEFLTVLSLVDTLLQRLDLNDVVTVDSLLAHRPPNWSGAEPSLQSLVMAGLKSSVTYEASFSLLAKLAKVSDTWLVDSAESRVGALFTVALPCCLHVKDGGETKIDTTSLASDIARLAEKENSLGIARLMKSFAKGIIRTREDLLRQGVACIRESFGAKDASIPISLLLRLVCNSERWLRVKSMEILKLLFQQPQSKMPLARSELLNPLLRLLSTDLAPQALEVLDEPLAIAAGPSPAYAFRMSMAGVESLPKDESIDESGVYFGSTTTESGWSIPHPVDDKKLVDMCRANTLAVFETCKPNNRPSIIRFEPETRTRSAAHKSFFPLDNPASLGDLVSTLNDLNDFFREESSNVTGVTQLKRSRSKAEHQAAHNRVAEILSRSLRRASSTRRPSGDQDNVQPNGNQRDELTVAQPDSLDPPTPFIGLFTVSPPQTEAAARHESMDTLNKNFLRDVGEDSDSMEGTESSSHHFANRRLVPALSRPRNGSSYREIESGSETDEDSFALERMLGRPRRKSNKFSMQGR
jgi:hypothetical protein